MDEQLNWITIQALKIIKSSTARYNFAHVPNKAVCALGERSPLLLLADVRSRDEVTGQGGRVSVGDISAQRFNLARGRKLCEEGGIIHWNDFVCAVSRTREVVHATKGVFELDSLGRLNDSERLALSGSGSRPLDLGYTTQLTSYGL